MTRVSAFLLVIALGAMSASCERKQETAAGNVTSGVSENDAANATYATENTASGFMPLRNGHYEDSDRVVGELDALFAQGDLDGDGSADRAVLIVTSTGGSGVFEELYVLRRSNGQLTISAPAFLGDRVEVDELRIEHGNVVVNLLVQGANDPLCCPTQRVVYRFHLSGNTLIETTGQQRIYLKE